MGKKKRKYDKGASVGFLMALPTVLGLILLNIYPLCRTVYMSFFKSGAFGKWTFVGLDNYVTMFQSAGFWTVTKNTLLFMLLTVPVTVVLGLLIAVLLNQSINGKTAFRAIYFLPMVVAPAAVAMVWKWLFNAEYGIINIVLGALHLPSKIQWISDPKTALLACAIVTIWSSVGYDAILLLSGLQSISKSYYEAARIDGSSMQMDATLEISSVVTSSEGCNSPSWRLPISRIATTTARYTSTVRTTEEIIRATSS